MKITITQPYGFTQIGGRKIQQDAMAPSVADAGTAYFVVCDGVGGVERGEVASCLVSECVERLMTSIGFSQGCSLGVADVERMLHTVYGELYANRSISRNMATTLALMAITDAGMLIAHVGDSPAFQVRRGEGIVFRTADHSLVAELLRSGAIGEYEAASHPQRNIITRSLSVPLPGKRLSQATVDIIRDVRPGDVFMLCTDGVNGYLSGDYIGKLLSSARLSLREKCDMLKSQTAGSHDNNTAWLVEVDRVEGCGSSPGPNTTHETHVLNDVAVGGDQGLVWRLRAFLSRLMP